MKKEAVYYTEMHTMMYQIVKLKIDESMIKKMLSEELSEENKRELIQAYYVCELDKGIEIKAKRNYGAWNASIDDITNIYQYQANILEKLIGNVTKEEVEKEIGVINNEALGLSDNEKNDSLRIQKEMLKFLGLLSPSKKM